MEKSIVLDTETQWTMVEDNTKEIHKEYWERSRRTQQKELDKKVKEKNNNNTPSYNLSDLHSAIDEVIKLAKNVDDYRELQVAISRYLWIKAHC